MSRPELVVVVESPAKAITLQRQLPRTAVVRATRGHLAQLAPGAGGSLLLSILPGRAHLLQELRSLARHARLAIATDPDREGEAIAWSIAAALGVEGTLCRVVLGDLAPATVREALSRPRLLDRDRLNAHLVRRHADARVAGLLRRAAGGAPPPGQGLGRVLAVALDILAAPRGCGIEVVLGAGRRRLRARAVDGNGAPLFLSGARASALAESLSGGAAVVERVEEAEDTEPAPPALATAALLTWAAGAGIGSARAMAILQRLYEGVDLGEEGTSGLVTYPRTDGQSHEAIRPVRLDVGPEQVASALGRDERRLHAHVHAAALASVLGPAVRRRRTTFLRAGAVGLALQESALVEPGHRIALGERRGRLARAPLVGHVLPVVEVTQVRGEPDEAGLLRSLDRERVGRPSTIGAVVAGLRARGLAQGSCGSLRATAAGRELRDRLAKRVPELLAPELTTGIEALLDRVEAGGASLAGALLALEEQLDRRSPTAALDAGGEPPYRGASSEAESEVDPSGFPDGFRSPFLDIFSNAVVHKRPSSKRSDA